MKKILTAIAAIVLLVSCGRTGPVDPMFRWPSSGCAEADSLMAAFEHLRLAGVGTDSLRSIVDRMYDCSPGCGVRNIVMSRAMYCDARLKSSAHHTYEADRLHKAALVLLDPARDSYDFFKWKSLNRDSTSYENYRIQLEALQYFKTIGDNRETACRYEYMGCMMLELDNRPRAHELFCRAYSLFMASGDTTEATKALMNIAVASPNEQVDSVLRMLLAHPAIRHDSSSHARTLANYYISTDSLEYLEEAIRICNGNPVDSLECLPLFYAFMGDHHTRHGDPASGTAFLETALSMMTADYPADFQVRIYDGLADAYLSQGRFRESAIAAAKEDSLELLLAYEARHSALLNADMRAEIELLENERKLSEERMRWVYVSLILSIILVTMTVVFIFYRRSKLRSMEALRAEIRVRDSRNKIVAASAVIEEKERLIGELSERLSLIREEKSDIRTGAGEMLGIISRHNRNRTERESFLKTCENNGISFESDLRKAFPTLSERQVKIAAWIAAGVDSAQIARILNIDQLSVNKARYRLKSKLGLSKEQNLDEFLRTFSHD